MTDKQTRELKTVAFHLNCLTQGGAERVVSNLANQFAAEGYKVYVATEWVDENEFVLDERVERVHVGLRPGDENKDRVTKFLLRVKYLREFLKEKRPDVLAAFMQRANYRALMANPGTGVPAVVCVRIDPTKFYNAFSDKVQINLLFPRAAGAVFQTEEQRSFFRPWLQDNSRIILNPVNPKYFGVERPAPECREKSVVHHARLVDFKNQALLIDAFLKVHERHPDFVLRIYGPDSGDGTKEILEKKIKENSAENFIFLMGGSDSLEKELPKGTVYGFSSDYEGFPNSLLEAMALGLPCVATDCPCGGPRTIIKDGENGILVPIKDPEALAAGLLRVIEDPELAERLGNNARKIEELTNVKSIYEQWADYLRKVVNGTNRETEASR